MTTLPLPSPARVPMAVVVGVLVLAAPLSLLRGGPDDASAGASQARVPIRADVRVASALSAAPGGPGPAADVALVRATAARGERSATPPPPTGRLAEVGTQLLDSLGIEHADPVNHGDLMKAAHTLGVRTDGWVREEHLDAMVDAHRQRAKPVMAGLGLPVPEVLAADDVRAAAGVIGLDVGDSVDPGDVDAVIQQAPDFNGGPTPRFAVVGGINMRLPSRVPLMTGFHQASYANTIGMADVGFPTNRVLPSRARGTSNTSAVDVRVPPNTTVLSPIRGTVVEVTPYALYGKYPDVKIRMVPESDPNLLVTILHVSDPKVRVGQVLEAGDTLAGRATQFPFESQIDRFAGHGPHVHIEARPR